MFLMRFFVVGILFFVLSCKNGQSKSIENPTTPYILVLGVAQDAGYPQIACTKQCCVSVKADLTKKRLVSSIALIDPISNESWMFDATPDFTAQTAMLSKHLKGKNLPDGLFLTHGHIGHYTGIMYLGREAMNADRQKVHAMPRMQNYLKSNGPWEQLHGLKNVEFCRLKNDSSIVLNKRISVTPFLVPHRDEYTETVGYLINNGQKKAVFIPDIDKWNKWNRSIVNLIKDVDIAFLDATFFKDGEINRDMSEVPHPFVKESMTLFEQLSEKDKNKIYFIHFNHTNPLLIEDSEAQKEVYKKGFYIAKQGEVIPF